MKTLREWCEENNRQDLLEQWNKKKNGDLTPDNVSYGDSRTRVWWHLPYDDAVTGKHFDFEWQSVIGNRAKLKSTGCPYLVGHAVWPGFNDLATLEPNLAREWNYAKNGSLLPTRIRRQYNKPVWWCCEFGHAWCVSPNSRLSKGKTGCPVCNNQHHTSFSEQAVLYYVSKCYPDVESGNKTAIGMELDIYVPNESLAIEYDGFNWHSSDDVYRRDLRKNKLCLEHNIRLIRIRESGLDVLSECDCLVREDIDSDTGLDVVIRQVLYSLCGDICDVDCARDKNAIMEQYKHILHDNSLAVCYPNIASQWLFEKNDGLTPFLFAKSSDYKAWWRCENGHDYRASISSRTRMKSGCPYCAGKVAIKGKSDLLTLFPDLCNEWDYDKNIGLMPSDVRPGSSKSVWWKCSLGHEYQEKMYNRVGSGRKKALSCPYCSNHRILIGFNDLKTKRPDIAAQWDYDGNRGLKNRRGDDISTPDKVLETSNYKVSWQCKRGHTWPAVIRTRTGPDSCGCPYCSHKQGQKVMNIDTGEIFNSLLSAAQSCGSAKLKSNICGCCTGRLNIAGGYHWRYVD